MREAALYSSCLDSSAGESCLWERAVAYGDGVFETIIVFNGFAPLWSYHRTRLQSSLARLHIQADLADIEQKLFALMRESGNALLKLIVARSGGKRGYDARAALTSVFSIQRYPLPQYTSDCLLGVALHVCSHVLSCNPALAGIKHLNRLEQVLAASEWNRSWAQEGLLLSDAGNVIECVSSNIFIVSGDVLQTPRLDICGVAGVMRAVILQEIAPALHISVQEARLTLADFLASDECFVCNSVFGLWPVTRIDASFIGNGSHAYTAKILQTLQPFGYGALYA